MPKFRVLRPEWAGTDMESTDIWKFVFHEEYPTFKIANTGSAEITIPAHGDSAYYDIVHNLGYTPFHFGFIRKGTKSKLVPGYMPISGITVVGDSFPAADVSYYITSWDANTVRIGVYMPYDYAASAETFTVTWEIMLDEV